MRRPSSLRGSISTLIMRKDISRLVMLTSENGFTETEKKLYVSQSKTRRKKRVLRTLEELVRGQSKM